jgi:hypothetical protein
MDIWDILLPFGTLCVDLEHFFWFWYQVPRKIWQPRTPAVGLQASSKNATSVSPVWAYVLGNVELHIVCKVPEWRKITENVYFFILTPTARAR